MWGMWSHCQLEWWSGELPRGTGIPGVVQKLRQCRHNLHPTWEYMYPARHSTWHLWEKWHRIMSRLSKIRRRSQPLGERLSVRRRFHFLWSHRRWSPRRCEVQALSSASPFRSLSLRFHLLVERRWSSSCLPYCMLVACPVMGIPLPQDNTRLLRPPSALKCGFFTAASLYIHQLSEPWKWPAWNPEPYVRPRELFPVTVCELSDTQWAFVALQVVCIEASASLYCYFSLLPVCDVTWRENRACDDECSEVKGHVRLTVK